MAVVGGGGGVGMRVGRGGSGWGVQGIATPRTDASSVSFSPALPWILKFHHLSREPFSLEEMGDVPIQQRAFRFENLCCFLKAIPVECLPRQIQQAVY